MGMGVHVCLTLLLYKAVQIVEVNMLCELSVSVWVGCCHYYCDLDAAGPKLPVAKKWSFLRSKGHPLLTQPSPSEGGLELLWL